MAFGAPKQSHKQFATIYNDDEVTYDDKLLHSRSQAQLSKKTKYSQKNTVASSRNIFAQSEQTLGPGEYSEPKKFGDDVVSYTFSAKKDQKIDPSAGPGEYDLDRSVSATRYRSPSAIIDGSPARGSMISKDSAEHAGPGQYNPDRAFGEDTNNFTI